MNRKFFCVSLAIFAALPTLFAFFDDDSYQYIADVSLHDLTPPNHIHKDDTDSTETPHDQPTPSPTTTTTADNCDCGKFKREGIFRQRIFREGIFREGEILEREFLEREKF